MKKNNFNFKNTFRVRYSEVDAQGIVFNAHYFTYFDCAITEYYRIIKFDYINDVKKTKKDFHVIKTITDFKKPILFDQVIDCAVRVSKIGVTSLTYELALYPNRKNDLLAFCTTIQVYTDQTINKSTPLSNNLIKKFKKFEKL